MKTKINYVWLVLFFIVLTSQGISAQTRITGTVKDPNGITLPGASIIQLNTQNGVLTDAQGNYSITLQDDGAKSLVFTFIGYLQQTVPYMGNAVINVVLQEEKVELSEVVVMGYTTQKKSALTGAVGTVNMGDLEQRKVADVGQILQGQVAGVQVTSSTGAPGDPIDITIRGVGTIGSSSAPLFIVDGLPTTNISFLNTTDILSMTVLKDASAAAIYGARASGGVVVITTKSGKKGKASIDINYYNGIQKVANLPTMLNATQYMDKMEESWNNSGYDGTNPYTADKSRSDLANTDWLKELFGLGRSQSLQLSASGGSDNVQYFIAGGYYSQDGIVIYDNDKYQRYNFRTNVNANISDRFVVGTNLQISNSVQDKISSSGDRPGVIRHAFIRPPVISVFKDVTDPNYNAEDPYTDLPFYTRNLQENNGVWKAGANKYEFGSNPIALAYFTNDKRNNFKTFGNVYAEFAFLQDKGLKLKTNLGVDINMTHNKAINQNFGDDDGFQGDIPADWGLGRQNRPNSLNEDRGQETTITWTNTLNYSKIIQKHTFSALVGSEFITNKSSSIGATRSRYERINSAFQYIDFGGYQVTDKDGNVINTPWNGGSASEWALFSVFASVNYNFDNRFFVTASLREDASSQFAEKQQNAFFPSVSAGWRISQEKFMQDVSWISDLKLRVSTGKLGNQSGLSNYNSLAIYDPFGTLLRYGNPDLKWETTQQDNIGLDFGLVKNKVYVTVDYFKKTTSDILLPLSLPKLVGDVQPTMVNAGTVSNKGFELVVGYKNNDHDFKYSVNGNIATVSNNVDKLHPNLPNIMGAVSKTEAGHPLNAFYGFEMTGIYQNQNEIDAYLTGAPHPDIKPGDIKFKDMNDDGIIDDTDRTYLGDPNPRLTYGLNLSATYKGFDLALLFQGVSGVEKYNDLKKIIDYDTRPFNHSVATLNTWHGEGTSNTMPRSTFNDNGSSKVSSIFVEDASYFRLKNIEIGYSLKSFFGKPNAVFKDVRFYVSAQNLMTITNYTGLDPESVNMIDQGTYPQSKAFLFGVNIKL